jgi:uncharacterized membrane protein
MSAAEPNDKTAADLLRLELVVGNLLRFGVLASTGLVLVGLGLSLLHHPDYLHNAVALGGPREPGGAFPATAGQLYSELLQFRGRAVACAGLILLIATPALRVVVSLIAFARERNWRFVGITFLVLVVLLLSLVLGRIE